MVYIPLCTAIFSSLGVFYVSTASLVPASTVGVIVPTGSAIVFWFSLTAVLLVYPLWAPLKLVAEAIRTRVYMVAVPPTYFVIHLFVYGLLLERLLVQVFGASGVPPTGLQLYYSQSYAYYPHTPWNALVTLTVQPSVNLTVPAYYSLAIGPFSIMMAVVITVLVTASVHVLMELGLRFRSIGESIAIPVLGVSGGASCCLSIPVLLEYFSPAFQAAVLTPLGTLALNVLYYALPLSVALALKMAVDGLHRTCTMLKVVGHHG